MASSSKHAPARNSPTLLLSLGLTALGLAGIVLDIRASRFDPAPTAQIVAEPPSVPLDAPQQEQPRPAAQPSYARQPPEPGSREPDSDDVRVMSRPNSVPLSAPHQALRASCDQGEVVACRELEKRQYDLLDAQAAGLRARELEACAVAANQPCAAHSRSELTAKAADEIRALCQRQGPESCVRLANRQSRDETPDQHLITDLWRAACDAGYDRACFELAERYERGLGVPRDEQRALALRERIAAKARDRGDPCGGNPMCFRVSRPPPPEPDQVRPITLQPQTASDPIEASVHGAVCNQQPCWTLRTLRDGLERCALGHGSACWQIHLAYEGGRGVHPDAAKSEEYKRMALRLRDAQRNRQP